MTTRLSRNGRKIHAELEGSSGAWHRNGEATTSEQRVCVRFAPQASSYTWARSSVGHWQISPPLIATLVNAAQCHSGPVWGGRFGVHLKGLLPSMNGINAVQHVVVTWSYACHIELEEAADIFHDRLLRKKLQDLGLAARDDRVRHSTAGLEMT